MFGIGIGEVLVVGVVCIIFLGDKNLPQHFKTAVKGLAKARRSLRDVQNAWYKTRDEIERSLDGTEKKIAPPTISKHPHSLEESEENIQKFFTPEEILESQKEEIEEAVLEKENENSKSSIVQPYGGFLSRESIKKENQKERLKKEVLPEEVLAKEALIKEKLEESERPAGYSNSESVSLSGQKEPLAESISSPS